MPAADDIYVDHFTFALGDLRRTLEESNRDARLLSDKNLLAEAGFQTHYRCSSNQNSYHLAKQSLEPIKQYFQDIGVIIYSNCLPQNGNIGDEKKFAETKDVKYFMDFPASHLQADFGLDRAFTVGLSQQACTGMIYGIRSARALLLAEPEVGSALCLTADRFPEGAIYEQAYNVISDGAAACIVSRKKAGFRYIASHGITNGALALASDDETVGSFFNYTYRLFEETLAKAKLTRQEINWIVPQNMNKKAWEILASVLSFDKDHVALASMSQIGHMISGDNVLNLISLLKEDRIRPGEKLFMPVAGYGLNWHALILEKV